MCVFVFLQLCVGYNVRMEVCVKGQIYAPVQRAGWVASVRNVGFTHKA